jgi:hypothetical protein
MWLLLVMLAAPPPPADAGADLSDEEFAKTFGKPRPKKGEKERKPAAYVPPAPGSAGPAALEKLEPKHVKDVVLAAKADIARCAAGQPNLQKGKATLTLQWLISLDGRVTKVEVVGDELKGSYVAGCVMKLVKRWTFPKHTVATDPVVFPFNL